MTVITYTIDDRVSKPKIDGGTYLWGRYITRNTTGGDRTAADKAAGTYPPHAYSGTRSDSLFGDYWLSWRQGSLPVHEGREAMAGGTGVVVTQLRNWNANDDLLLLGKLSGKIRGHDWHAGVFIGELGKTVDTVASRIRQLGRAALAVKRGNIKSAFKLLNVSPEYGHVTKFTTYARSNKAKWYEVWLEMRYAWRPLVYDIYQLSEAIRTLDAPRTVKFRVSHFIGKSVASAMPTIFAVKGSGRYSKQIIATYSEQQPSLLSHLGLDDPGSLLWELLPFSFVVDWVIPIGNYIQTRSTLQRAQGSFVLTTFDWHRGRVVGMAPGYSPDVTPPSISEYKDPSGWSNSYYVNRTLSSSLSVPLPTFRNPLGSNPGTRVMDAVALLRAVFSSRGSHIT